jgi:hypothetical protein
MSFQHSAIGLPRPEDVLSYLRRHKWQVVEVDDQKVVVLEGGSDDSGSPLRVMLPARADFRDAPSMILDIIDLLEAVENRPAKEIALSMSIHYKDVIRQRVIAPSLNGTISLGIAAEVVSSLRNMFVQAACQEENPSQFIVKATKNAMKFADHCRFGHTFHGSFGFVVECPIEPRPQQTDLLTHAQDEPPAPPFERRVTQRIATGLSDLGKALREANPNPIISNHQKGFNANLCEVIVEIAELLGEAEAEFAMLWSPEWEVPEEAGRLRPIRITRDVVPFLSSAARALRSGMGESRTRQISGRVIAFRSREIPDIDQNELFDNDRVIVILAEVQRGKAPLQVHVPLTFEEYQQAWQAHTSGRPVSVTGTLEKDGKFWKLTAPSDFKVLETTPS